MGVRHVDLCALITNSSPDEWLMLRSGPFFADGFARITDQTGTWLETEGHPYFAVWREDVDLRLGWGITVDSGLQFGDRWIWPDRQIQRVLVDGFWRGALVARWTTLLVDGGRCYLPEPALAYVRTGDGLRDHQAFGSTMVASEVRLARLIHGLGGGSDQEFERYLAQTQVIEVPDDPAGVNS
jgi:hypothetical protein